MRSGNKCFLGVLFIFQSLVQSNGKLSIMANEAILHNVYIARSEIIFTRELLYSGNYGTLLIIKSKVTFSGINTFSYCKTNTWAGALTGIQSTINVTGIASFLQTLVVQLVCMTVRYI